MSRESHEEICTGTSAVELKQSILDNLCYVQGKVPELATKNDWYIALAYTVRDRMIEHFIRWMKENIVMFNRYVNYSNFQLIVSSFSDTVL